MNYNILAINPGSTSTKIALYENDKEILCKSLEHSIEEIEKFNSIQDQFDMRKNKVITFLKSNGYDINKLSAVVGRGGMVPKVSSGAYKVNDIMVNRLKYNPVIEHASNLGALIAYEIANKIGIPAYIYDSVRVDEMIDLARISGMADIERTSTSHVLNSRATAMKVAKMYSKKYSEMNFVIAHLGGGISLSVYEKGRLVDIISDDEGPFSPERSGRVPCKSLIDLCYNKNFDKETMNKKLRGNGGIKSYLNTIDVREVEKMIEEGNEKAKLILEAMAYQVAKGIGELSTVLEGKVDVIIITGGIAYSDRVTSWIRNRVRFIAPVEIMPGENEMEALSQGTLRVLMGEEIAREYYE
ncbi:butyrate kinase [Clostridium nigeriense]|uniref:butyrate kinase n=1 Tax=Clostridium nigeriense TaxID=1805470 RepID=UPI0008378BE8|nr:butyrate kinase [Clostridium nigeriense]